MKTDRLIGIITTIQQKGTVTAPYLAEKFGVSRRTINRDIEDICKAGIPLLTKQGAGGGVFLAPNFTLSSTVFEQKIPICYPQKWAHTRFLLFLIFPQSHGSKQSSARKHTNGKRTAFILAAVFPRRRTPCAGF